MASGSLAQVLRRLHELEDASQEGGPLSYAVAAKNESALSAHRCEKHWGNLGPSQARTVAEAELITWPLRGV